MIVLTVLSYNGAPGGALSASFDELGGTIGRAENNQLVLPDPERTISRVHARVVFRGGGFAIVDNGSNPISVNGKLLGSGREQPLAAGDKVTIGGYVIEVGQGGAARSGDTFTDLFGDGAMGLAAPAPAAPAPGWPTVAPAPSGAWPAPALAAPWPAPASPPAVAALAPGQIPEDWDPFGTDHGLAAPAPPRASAGDAGFGLAQGSDGHSLDDLFGLGPGGPVGDPLAGIPQQSLALGPNTAAHADPLEALARPAAIGASTVGDLGSDLHMPMPLPLPGAAPRGAVFSWDKPSRDGRIVTLPGVRRNEAEPPAPAPAPLAPPADAPPVAAPSVAAPRPPAAGDDALLAAFLQGLDAPDLRVEVLTPELMRLIGQLLHESTRGTVELLIARAALKREMRAQLTMIVAKENNPLKFSPSAQAALQHLLGPQTPGFMAAAPAMRDAFDDLRAHQMAVMAGMKAALDGVLQRFDPRQLEGKLTRRSALDSLIPSTRKARLWELFQELFTQLSGEAQDDFDELFGKAFLRAYEAQLDRLHEESGPR